MKPMKPKPRVPEHLIPRFMWFVDMVGQNRNRPMLTKKLQLQPEVILAALKQTPSRSSAARILGVSPPWLATYCKTNDIDINAIREVESSKFMPRKGE